MFINEVRASLADWTRRWNQQPSSDYTKWFDALTPEEQEQARTLFANVREAMTAFNVFHQQTK